MNHWFGKIMTSQWIYIMHFLYVFFLHQRLLKKNLLKTMLPLNELWITSASVKAHLSTWQCESVKANKGKKGSCTLALQN